jgi:hypothetical protein
MFRHILGSGKNLRSRNLVELPVEIKFDENMLVLSIL